MATDGLEQICQEASRALKSGDYTSGRQLYERAVAMEDDSPDAHFGLATCSFALDDLDAALKHFSRVIKLDPDRATCYINIGAIYNRLGDQQKAIRALRKGINCDPNRSEAYYNLGIALKNAGDTMRAAKAYLEATRLNPRMADAYYNLGNALKDMERYKDALKAYHRAVKVNPKFDKARAAFQNLKAFLEKYPDPEDEEQAKPTTLHFNSPVERANALAKLRDLLKEQKEHCLNLEKVIEEDLLLSQRDLSRTLVGTPGVGELEMHAESYGRSLQQLATAHKALENGANKLRELKLRFHAQAERNS